MSKEAEARVRDELLQQLYASTLHCSLAGEQAGTAVRAEASAATAAGVCANLRPADLLLLPRRGAGTFRVLRGLPWDGGQSPQVVERAAGVLPLPGNLAHNGTAAVSFALGAAVAAAHSDTQALVCVVLPAAAMLAEEESPGKSSQWPTTWTGAAMHAAKQNLPLLLVTDGAPRASAKTLVGTSHLEPAPLYPSIPVDREDALAMYRVAFECTGRARNGGGPSQLACVSFRVRAQEEAQSGSLARLEAMLRSRGAFHKAWHRELERQLVRKLSGELPTEPARKL